MLPSLLFSYILGFSILKLNYTIFFFSSTTSNLVHNDCDLYFLLNIWNAACYLCVLGTSLTFLWCSAGRGGSGFYFLRPVSGITSDLYLFGSYGSAWRIHISVCVCIYVQIYTYMCTYLSASKLSYCIKVLFSFSLSLKVLTFKEINWQMIRIEADAIQSSKHEIMSAPVRLITNQSKIRVTLKRRVNLKSLKSFIIFMN